MRIFLIILLQILTITKLQILLIEFLKEIKKISDEFANKTWSMQDQSIPLRNLDEVFILASVVEMETSLSHEKPIISGVFFNRLNKKMRLQSDPTVLFSITKGKSKLERQLTRKDLKYKSPYNTYVNKGFATFNNLFSGKGFCSISDTTFEK